MPSKKRKLKYQTSASLPKLSRPKLTWDLKSQYYQSVNDPKLKRDVAKAKKAYGDFARKWKSGSYLKNRTKLKQALTEYEALAGLAALSRPGRYLSLRLALNVGDTDAKKLQARLAETYRTLSNEIIFFTLTLGKLPQKEQRSILKDDALTHWHYWLSQVFSGAEHDLTEAEEKIIKLKSRQSYGMWVNAVDTIVSNRSVTWKGHATPIPEALEILDLQTPSERKKLWKLLMTELEQIGEVAEHEFNAIITDVRTEEALRGYQKPYSATVLAYQDTEASVEALVAAVSTTGFAFSKKFYAYKAKLHKQASIHYTQKYDSIGVEPSVTFTDAITIARDVFYKTKRQYGEIFDDMLQRGQIDVYPKPGKTGGAFMSSQTGHPTNVLLNHVDNFKSLETIAHEMGHAIHAARSGTQTPLYDGHSITTAETASTLFETLLFAAVYAQADEAVKPILLHDRMTRDIATIQRQIAAFNCELEIHNTISAEGAMTNHELRDCMYRHLKSYLGPAVEITKTDGYSYVYWSHLRYGFYVYTYAFGQLMSALMAKRLTEDSGYIKNIDAFLCAGESANTKDIYQLADIDITQPTIFAESLALFEQDFRNFKKVTKV